MVLQNRNTSKTVKNARNQLNKYEYFIKADLRKYKGQYVAIVGDKVIASGENAKEVWEEAKKKTDKIPTLAKIPKEEALILMVKWK